MMRPYLALLKQQMRVRLQFRAALLGQVATNIFWALTRAAILRAFYTSGAGSASISLAQAVNMCWLTEICLYLMPGYLMDYSIWTQISRGEVGYDLLRPLDLYAHWYARTLAGRFSDFLLVLLPVGAAGLLMPGGLGLRLTAPPLSILAGVFTLATGMLLSCAMILVVFAACMDVHVGSGPASALMTCSQILAGSILPLQLWPDFMQGFLAFQPFASMMDLPMRFLAGSAGLSELPRVLLVQGFWFMALLALGRFWVKRNLRRMVIQGG